MGEQASHKMAFWYLQQRVSFSTINVAVWGEAKIVDSIIGALSLGLTIVTIGYLADQLLSRRSREDAAMLLLGLYNDRLPAQFEKLFDAIFGHNHFTLSCFTRSCFSSLVAVSIAFFFFSLSGEQSDALNVIGYFEIFLLCMLINLIPDYLSLLETRYVVSRLARVRGVTKSCFWLLVDFLSSLAIIGSYIGLLLLIFPGLVLNLINTNGLSFLFIFIFSSLLSSLLLWLYVISSFVLTVFDKWKIYNWLDVETSPLFQISILSGLIVFTVYLVISMAFSELSLETEIANVRGSLQDQGFRALSRQQVISALVAFVFLLWATHSACFQSLPIFFNAKTSPGWLLYSQLTFSVFAILLLASKILFFSLWQSIEIPSGSAKSNFFHVFLAPTSLPKWQIASAFNGIVGIFFWRMALRNADEPIKDDRDFSVAAVFGLRSLRVISAGLSGYSICVLVYLSLTIEWQLPPICDGFFPWQESSSTCY